VHLARCFALAFIIEEKGRIMLMTRMQDVSGKPIEDFLTIDEATELTGYSDQYLRRMAKEGKLRAVKRSHFWLIDRFSLEAYFQAAQHTDDQRFGPREQSE
jgi:excisionase family DNA binding protein